LALGAVPLAACGPFRPERPDSDAPRRPLDLGYRLRPVDEALWVCDEDGVLWALDARTDTITARIPLGLTLPHLSVPALFAGTVVWAYEFQTGAIVTVDPRAAQVTGRATVPGAANLVGLAASVAGDALWVAHHGRAWRIDSGAHVTSTPLPADFTPECATATSRWLWLAADDRLARIDAAGRTPAHLVDLPASAAVRTLVTGSDAMYAVSQDGARTWVLDLLTGQVRSELNVGEAVSEIFPVGPDLWIAGMARTVHRVRAGRVETFTVVPDGIVIESGVVFAGSMWLCVLDPNELVEVDLNTATVSGRVPVEVAEPEDPNFWAYAGARSLWVLDADFYNGISRVDPIAGRARKLVPTTGITMRSVVAAPTPRHPASPRPAK
jgi:DNA-binding beta-propeller fold protein YncE